jgi:HlyD family secretion protein
MTETSPPSGNTRNTRGRRWLWGLIALLIILAAAAAAYFWLHKAPKPTQGATLRTVTAKAEDFQVTVIGPGSLTPVRTLDVTAQVSGPITSIVSVGQRVNKGDVLVKINSTTFQRAVDSAKLALQKAQAQLAADQAGQAVNTSSLAQQLSDAKSSVQSAQRQLDAAKKTLSDDKTLYQASAVSAQTVQQDQDAYDQAVSALSSAQLSLKTLQQSQGAHGQSNTAQLRNDQVAIDQAQLTLQNAQDDLAHTVITAPWSGIVGSVSAQAGGATAGSSTNGGALMTLLDDSQVLLPVQIDETQINQVKVGQSAKVTLGAIPGRTFKGKVTAITPAATLSNNIPIFEVNVLIDNAQKLLKPGMTAQANIVVQDIPHAVTVPRLAVSTAQGQSFVRVVTGGGDNQQVQMRPVTLGPSSGNTVVTKGLEPGAVVVLSGAGETGAPTGRGGSRGRPSRGIFFGR